MHNTHLSKHEKQKAEHVGLGPLVKLIGDKQRNLGGTVLREIVLRAGAYWYFSIQIMHITLAHWHIIYHLLSKLFVQNHSCSCMQVSEIEQGLGSY